LKSWDERSELVTNGVRKPLSDAFFDFTTYHYARRMLPDIDLFTISVKLPDMPDIAKRINEHLKTWTDGFPGDDDTIELLEGFTKWYGSTSEYPYRFQPLSGRWENYLTVSYILQTYDGPSTHMPMVYTICFDMVTGDVVNFADVIPTNLPFEEAFIVTPILHFEGNIYDYTSISQEYFDRYVPLNGSVICDAWLLDSQLGLCIIEPNGRKLQIFFYGDWNLI